MNTILVRDDSVLIVQEIERTTGNLLHDSLGGRCADIVHDDVRTELGEQTRVCATEARPGARDDNCLAVEAYCFTLLVGRSAISCFEDSLDMLCQY